MTENKKTYKKEADVKKDIDKALKAVGAYPVMYVPVGFGKGGVPDYVASVGGVFVGIEAKLDAKKNPPAQLQMHNLMSIKNSGGLAVVVDQHNVAGLEQFLKAVIAFRGGLDVSEGRLKQFPAEYTAAPIVLRGELQSCLD